MAENVIADNPCTQCFQGQQLDALIVNFLATKAGFTLPDDLSELIAETACLKCLSDTQLKDNLASALWSQFANGQTANDLMEQIACLNCANPQTVKALTNHLLILGLTT